METDDAAKVLIAEERRKQAKKDKAQSKEDLFDFQLRSHRLPPFVRWHKFALETHQRRFEFDFCNTQYMIAVEVEGLVVVRIGGETVVKGRHASISGFKEDCIKYAIAAELGWTVLRFEQSQVKDGTAIDMTMRVLYARGWRRAS